MSLNKILIPMIRKIDPINIAEQLCSVQPMSGPTGMIFSLRSTYGLMEDLVEEAFPDFDVLFDEVFAGQYED